MLQQFLVVAQLLFLRACCGGSFLSNSSRMMALKNRTSCHFVFLSECHKCHEVRFVFSHFSLLVIALIKGMDWFCGCGVSSLQWQGEEAQSCAEVPQGSRAVWAQSWALQSAAHFLTLLLGGCDLSKDGNSSCPQLQEWRQDFSPFPPQSMNNPRSGCWGPCSHLPSGFLSMGVSTATREVLYSTAPADCCEKNQSQTNQIFSPWNSATLRSNVSTEQGEREGWCLVKHIGWRVQVPPAA